MLLRTLVLFSFLTSAHAGFEIDEQELKEFTLSCPNPKTRFELTTDSHSSIPHLKIRSAMPETGEFIEGTVLTFEEHCRQTSNSLTCPAIDTPLLCDPHPKISALKSQKALFFSNEQLLRLNCGTIICDAEITFQSDHVQANCFFKTSRSVIIKSHTPQLSINEFVLTPYPFNFVSTTGQPLPSSSLYAAIDINFLTNSYHIIWQSAHLSILEGQIPMEDERQISMGNQQKYLEL